MVAEEGQLPVCVCSVKEKQKIDPHNFPEWAASEINHNSFSADVGFFDHGSSFQNDFCQRKIFLKTDMNS